jgi:hypothetical protein
MILPCQNDKNITDLIVKNFQTGSNGCKISLESNRIITLQLMTLYLKNLLMKTLLQSRTETKHKVPMRPKRCR